MVNIKITSKIISHTHIYVNSVESIFSESIHIYGNLYIFLNLYISGGHNTVCFGSVVGQNSRVTLRVFETGTHTSRYSVKH